MQIRSWAAAGVAAAFFLIGTTAFAQTTKPKEKHESNTLRKIGKGAERAGKTVSANVNKAAKATEYGVRKGGENVSVTAHRATGKNSVVRDRGKKQDYVITPDGKHIPIADRDKKKSKP